jgi:spore germination protein
LFDEKIIKQINNFSNELYQKLKKENTKYAIAIYGDVFYRMRPYDVLDLSKNSDEIMIMAYDFHKSIGEPGPNFPLNKKEIYNYDFKKMIDDFLRYVSKDKISVIFGLYGYDWIVDEKGRPIKSANALSYNEIKNKYLNNCSRPKCKIFVDNVSTENRVELVNNDSKKHIIWFEDERSVNEKINYLKSKRIFNYSYWANGYF